MNATELLKHDHDEVEELFERFDSAGSSSEKRSILDNILSELDVHASIEEQVFYPAVQSEVSKLDDLVREGIEEHHVVEQLMTELATMEPDHPQFEAKVKVLKENVEHHVEEEEEGMFPEVESALDPARLDELGAAMAQAKGKGGSY